MTLQDCLIAYDEKTPSHVFLRDEKESYTIHETGLFVENLTRSLSSFGIQAQDLVALKAERTKETFLLFLALQALGAISLLTDAHLSIQDYLAKEKIHLKPAFQIEKDGQGQLRLSDTKGHQVPLTFSQETNPDAKPFSEICSQDGSVGTILIHTSGSTGKAKGVFLSQEAFIRNSQDTFALADYRPDDVALAFLPFHHVFGLALAITALVNQHTLFAPQATDPLALVKAIQTYGVTRMNGVPTLYLDMVKAKTENHLPLTCLRTGLIGGGPWTESQFGWIEKTLGIHLIPVYGMSECIAISCGRSQDPLTYRQGSVGPFYPQNEGIFLGPDGSRLPLGQTGEIAVKSPFMMTGYYQDPEETKACFTKDGYLLTGDLGYLDKLGFLHLCGRRKDLIIRAGENIAPLAVENALLSLDGIEQACVFAVPSFRLGEKVSCAVVLKKGSSLTARQIQEALKPLLTKNEIPETIHLLGKLPLLASGKVDKQSLKETYAADGK